jgi:hypothetical protein
MMVSNGYDHQNARIADNLAPAPPPPFVDSEAPAVAENEPAIVSESPGEASPVLPSGPRVPEAEPVYPSRRLPRPLLILFEYWHARRASRRLLAIYRRVRTEQSLPTGRALYEEVVMRWAGVDRPAARSILGRAAQSFVDWNSERDLRFRDVALYLVVQEYMVARPERHGVVARMGNAVARVVAADL